MADSRYWVVGTPREVARKAYEHSERTSVRGSVPLSQIEKALSFYYGNSNVGSASGLTRGGSRGEQVLVYANLLRFYVQNLTSMIVGDRLKFSVTARRNSAAATRKAKLLSTVLDYFSKKLNFDSLATQLVELGLVGGKSFLQLTFDEYRGEAIDQRGTTEGGFRAAVYTLMDVIEPSGYLRDEDVPWRLVRDVCNRYDYMAQYVELAQKIVSLPDVKTQWTQYKYPFNRDWDNTDLIPHYTLYHKRTPALPDGYELSFLSGEVPLVPSGLAYSRVPLIPYMPSRVYGTTLGYTRVFDMLGPCEALNTILSKNITTHKVLGGNNIVLYKGSGINPPQLANGLNIFHVNPGMEPKQLQLGQLDPSMLPHAEFWLQILQQLSGMNDASLGNIGRETSGAALAQLDAKAVQFNSGAQEAFTTTIHSAAELLCEIFVTRMLSDSYKNLLGEETLNWAKTQDMSYLSDFSDVEIQFTNPSSGTPVMRMEEARLMLEQGLLRSPQQYLEMRDTGSIDPVLEGPREHSQLIRQENDMLRQGQVPDAMITDDHPQHFLGHRSVLDNPESRNDPAIVDAVSKHLWQQHMPLVMQLLQNPPMAILLGIDLGALTQLMQQQQAQQAMSPNSPNEPGAPNPPSAPGPPAQPNPDQSQPTAAPGAAPVE